MTDEAEHIIIARYLKTPPSARDEIAEHIDALDALILRHEAANAELLARVADRDQVIAGLRRLVLDYEACLNFLPEPTPGLTGLSVADLADLDALDEGPSAADPQKDAA